MHTEPILIAIAGPTASGKSELALRIAGRINGEIINCDSVQMYRGFDIGTAKLPESEWRGVPHYLIDILEPAEVFTAGEFARRARRVMAGIAERGKTPILAGGTGFYLRALIHGLSPGPRRDDDLRARLAAREKRRAGSVHRLLSRFDPPSARRIHANDVAKAMRALEICLLSRQPASLVLAQERDALTGYRVLKIGLFPPRDALYKRIDLRSERMFREGLLTEVEGLLGRGVPRGAKAFEALGYRQALQVIDGELSVSQAVFHTAQQTRNYAKRQMTWFRREPGISILHGFGDEEPVFAGAIALIDAMVR